MIFRILFLIICVCAKKITNIHLQDIFANEYLKEYSGNIMDLALGNNYFKGMNEIYS